MQAAYRLGARIAWRHLADAATAADIPPEALPTLAESIFAYIDELAGQSVEGYAEAQSAEAGERGRRRARLIDLLLTDDDVAVDREAVEAAAARAGWPLPRTLAAVALHRTADADLVARRVGTDVLSGRTTEGPLVLVPDPAGPGRAELLAGALGNRPAAIGPVVDPMRACASLQPARRLLALAGADAPVRVDDHLTLLALDAARDPLHTLGERRLAALEDHTPASRVRLEETLLVWLEQQGSAPAVARELHVHPQTVRYRLARLREALGDQLDDPQARFELQLVLKARQLTGHS